MNEIIKQNNPVDSDNENPKIAQGNNSLVIEGFLDTALIKAANTIAIPIPAPINPTAAIPAPIYLAPNTIFIINNKNRYC